MANDSEATAAAAISWPAAFWPVLKRVDRSKMNGVGLALRNALAVSIPLGVGIEIGTPLPAVAVVTGALNVAYSDGRDPYPHRARRMLAWSFLGAVAVFLGSVTGNYPVLAIFAAAGWAFVAGLLVAISTRAGDLGLNTLVTLIVYAARGALSPKGAFYAGLLVLAGGLLQTAFALLSWPIRRYAPERRAIGSVYLSLAQDAKAHPDDIFSSSLKQASGDVQDTLSALGRDHSLEGERFRLLIDQADRLRFSIYNVSRLGSPEALSPVLDQTSRLLEWIAGSLLKDDACTTDFELLAGIAEWDNRFRPPASSHTANEFASALDVLAGQLRVVAQLARNTTTAGAEELANAELAPPLKLQLRSWLSVLRVNLHMQSPAFRHGLRLAVCVAIGDLIGRSSGIQRNYWFAMTVAVVLKPDFTSTISRGVLRLCGTFGGLLLATALYHFLPRGALTQLVLVGIFTFFLRYLGPANYGFFSVAVSGLIVFLIATTGVAPAEVIGERAINTVGGGLFALIAYALWPTWERSQVSDVIADMMDRTHDYFHAVISRLNDPSSVPETELDRVRDAWRQARSDAEASVDRLSSEPRVNPMRLDALTSILSSSHALVRMTMILEAALVEPTTPHLVPAAFQSFARDIEFTLYYLSAALRGSAPAAAVLPQLREDHRRIVEEYKESSKPDDFLLAEADRLTVGLNTLREQVSRYISYVNEPVPQTAHTTIE